MLLQTAGAVSVPLVPAVNSPQVLVLSISIDMMGHTITVLYTYPGAPPGQVQRDTIPLPAPLQAALETHAQARVEASLGIAGTTVLQP